MVLGRHQRSDQPPARGLCALTTQLDASTGGDPNAPWVYRAFMQWSANDPEGTSQRRGGPRP